MREILFRGKRTDNDEWVTGNYIKLKIGIEEDVHNIGGYTLNSQAFRVNPETVGQYTGLTDKNGRKIFEGDVIYSDCPSAKGKYVIIFDDAEFVGEGEYEYSYLSLGDYQKTIEIIGNIHDNPELIGGKENE